MTGPRIEITTPQIRTMKGTSAKGKAYDMAMQDAYLHGVGSYPEKFELPMPKEFRDEGGNWHGYQVGFYTLTPDSYRVRDGRIGVDAYEMRLVAVVADAAAKARAA